MCEDLGVGLSFIENYNGVSVILDEQWQTNTALDLFTDAAGGIGFGVYFQGH